MIILFFILISIFYCFLMIWLAEGIIRTVKEDQNKSIEFENPFVSIIIAAKNEESNIVNLLSSLFKQSYSKNNYEIIIVDDRSTDQTSKFIKSKIKENKNLHHIRIDSTPIGWGHKKWALNSAIKITKGSIIIQTDADCYPNKNWIKSIVEGFVDPNTGFISGPTPLSSTNLIQELLTFENNAQDSFSAAGLTNGLIFSCVGRNIAFRKHVFDEIDGYSGIEHLESGDDDLLMHKICKMTKYKINFLFKSDAAVISRPPSSITKFINQRLRFASKGLFYYKWKADISLRLTLPLLYITNIISLISITQFTYSGNGLWLLPWVIKSTGDGVLTYVYSYQLLQKWKPLLFIFLSIIHPVYVVLLGGIGPFMKIKWKI